MSAKKKPAETSSAVATKKPPVVAIPKRMNIDESQLMYAKEYWTGDSRDGCLVNGDGYHYYRMTKDGRILEAYEYYETEEGREFVSPLPEMLNVHWMNDLGFEDFEALDIIQEDDFSHVKDIISGKIAAD